MRRRRNRIDENIVQTPQPARGFMIEGEELHQKLLERRQAIEKGDTK